MSAKTSHTGPHTVPFIFLLLLLLLLHACATHAAALPSSATSTSGTASTNQRSTRSVDTSGIDSEDSRGRCASDFVEKFFRVLSGPIGKEAEALVAAVVKLLSESDRVNWRAMADLYQARSRDSFPAPTLRRMLHESLARHEKRMAPKFNPTGWRRKRSVDLDLESLQTLLRGIIANPDTELEREDSPKMADIFGDVKSEPGFPTWQSTPKRDSLARQMTRRRHSQPLPKRKPLEFNPTGW